MKHAILAAALVALAVSACGTKEEPVAAQPLPSAQEQMKESAAQAVEAAKESVKAAGDAAAAGAQAVKQEAAAAVEATKDAATAAATAAWSPVDYTAVQWVEKGAEVYTVDTGQLTILPNLRTATAGDTRSQAEKALAAARAAFAAWTPTQRRYKIGEREMEFNSTAEILRTISYWEQQVARERGTPAAQGGRYYIRAR